MSNGSRPASGQLNKVRTRFQGLEGVVRASPSTVAWPVLLLAVLCGIGVWVVTREAHIAADVAKGQAISLATDAANVYRQQLSVAFAPIQVLAGLVQQEPQYDIVGRMFNTTAPVLMAVAPPNALQALQLVPSGVFRLQHPTAGNEGLFGVDLFAWPDAAVQAALRRTLSQPSLSMDGPLPPGPGGGTPVLVVRQAIHVSVEDPDETFGRPDAPNTLCGEACAYNATTGSKFWGFASGVIQLDRTGAPKASSGALSPLHSLERMGYRHSIIAPNAGGTGVAVVVSQSDNEPRNPVEAVLSLLPDVQWILRVSPGDGRWRPSWYGGVVAAVVIASLVAALMLFGLLVSRRRNEMLLKALLPSDIIEDLRTGNASALGPRQLLEDSPAELLLGLLGALLSGSAPDLRDVVLLRTVLQQHRDVYRPLNITGRIKEAQLDGEVTSALIRQLGDTCDLTPVYRLNSAGGAPLPARGLGQLPATAGPGRPFGRSRSGLSELSDCVATGSGLAAKAREAQLQAECSELRGALAFLVSPDVADDAGGPEPAARPRSPLLSTVEDAATNGLAAPALMSLMTGEGWSARVGPMAAAVAAEPGSPSRLHAQPQQQGPPSTSGVFLRVARTAGESAARVAPSRCVIMLGGGTAERGGAAGSPFVNPGRPASDAPASPLPSSRLGRGLRTSFDASAHEGGSSRHAAPGEPEAACVAAGGGGGVTELLPPPVAVLECAPAPPILEQVERLLSQTDGWQFDTWALHKASGGHALSCLGFYLLQRKGLIERFRMEPLRTARLLRALEAGYSATNPYHNAVHAADVLRNLHVLLHGARLTEHYLDPLGLLAAYFAAIMHDYEHRGLTNDFLVATAHPLALRYNDRCPLESHHCAAAFELLAERPELDATAGMSRQERTAFRKQVIELVLATDMKQHFATLTHFTAVHRLAPGGGAAGGGAQQPTGGAVAQGGAARSHLPNFPSMRDIGPLPKADLLPPTSEAPKPLDDAERLLSLQVALKVADLGHLGAEIDTHRRWLAALEEEFFRQGDQERERGLPISPLFDRTKQGASKSQVGFFKFVALPLIDALAGAFPGSEPLRRCFQANYEHWREVEGAASLHASPSPAAIKAAAAAAPAAGASSPFLTPPAAPTRNSDSKAGKAAATDAASLPRFASEAPRRLGAAPRREAGATSGDLAV